MAVDKEMEKPVVFGAAGFVSQFRKADHRGIHVKCVGSPDESAGADVGFGERDSRYWDVIGDEMLLRGMYCQAKGLLPVFARHFAHGDFRQPVLLLCATRARLRWAEGQPRPFRA